MERRGPRSRLTRALNMHLPSPLILTTLKNSAVAFLRSWRGRRGASQEGVSIQASRTRPLRAPSFPVDPGVLGFRWLRFDRPFPARSFTHSRAIDTSTARVTHLRATSNRGCGVTDDDDAGTSTSDSEMRAKPMRVGRRWPKRSPDAKDDAALRAPHAPVRGRARPSAEDSAEAADDMTTRMRPPGCGRPRRGAAQYCGAGRAPRSCMSSRTRREKRVCLFGVFLMRRLSQDLRN